MIVPLPGTDEQEPSAEATQALPVIPPSPEPEPEPAQTDEIPDAPSEATPPVGPPGESPAATAPEQPMNDAAQHVPPEETADDRPLGDAPAAETTAVDLPDLGEVDVESTPHSPLENPLPAGDAAGAEPVGSDRPMDAPAEAAPIADQLADDAAAAEVADGGMTDQETVPAVPPAGDLADSGSTAAHEPPEAASLVGGRAAGGAEAARHVPAEDVEPAAGAEPVVDEGPADEVPGVEEGVGGEGLDPRAVLGTVPIDVAEPTPPLGTDAGEGAGASWSRASTGR